MAYGSKPPKMVKKMAPRSAAALSPAIMKRLKEHSKLHKGGMSSKHMKTMVKKMKEGLSFSQAHKMAMAN